MPKGSEIVATYKIDRLEFVELVKAEKLKALWDLEAIDWKIEESTFIDCQRDIAKTITTKRPTNPFAGGKQLFGPDYVETQRAYSHPGEQVTLWSILADKLANAKKRFLFPLPNINYFQKESGGWQPWKSLP